MTTRTPKAERLPPRVLPTDAVRLLMYESLPYFMSLLRDVDGRALQVAAHHRKWCRIIIAHLRLVLLAPRDHSKTTTALVFILWMFFRHATDPATGRPRTPPWGTYQAVLVSATQAQAGALMARFRDLLAANVALFPKTADTSGGLRRSTAASETQVRLASGAELLTFAYGTSRRGLHPDLLVLDDVLNDQNSGSDYQRRRIWHYFTHTLLPMHPGRILIVGTAIHAADLLHRLSPRSATTSDGRVHGFVWKRFRAINVRSGRALWPARHPYAELMLLRDADPTMFAREYMNDPRDEVATYFPRSLTQLAVDAGAALTMVPWYRRTAREFVVLGADIARSERIGADYTVAIVVVVDFDTGERRVLTVRRERGLDFDSQIALFTDLSVSYGVNRAMIEDNGLQGWLLDALRARQGGDVFQGHTTGRGKMRFDADGIPMLKLALRQGLWVFPSGDEASRSLALIWQAELGAFGWRNGRVEGIGEHDDVVIASWHVELAITDLMRDLTMPGEEIVGMEYFFPGWKPVKIGPDY